MFSEVRLDLGINYGATFGPRFNTAIATQANGEESRRPLWSEPLIYAQLGEKMVNGSELEYLLDFHTTVQGAYSGFRLRDWSDFYAEGQSLLAGPTNTYQLIKTYTVGVYSVVRPITKPVADTVKLYANGVEQLSGWTIDTTTGVLTTAIAGTLTVDFEFDVPVRFEQDQISFRFQASSGSQKLFNLAPLNCTEIRLLPTVMPTLTAIPSEVAATISLGYDYRTTGGPQFNTLIATTASEFEDRIPLWDASLGSWEIGDRTMNRSELDYLLAWFRISRGQAVPFFFYDWQTAATKRVRFSEDRISVNFLAYRDHDKEAIFSLGGIGLKETAIGPVSTSTLQVFNQSFDPNLVTTHNFTIDPPEEVLQWENVIAYLVSGVWDDRGSIATFTPPYTPGQVSHYNGPNILISTGTGAISGTVENVQVNGCSVLIQVLWTGFA